MVPVKGALFDDSEYSDTFQYKNYFIKFPSFHVPNLIAWEHLSYELADMLRLNIPSYGVGHVYEYQDVYTRNVFITDKIEGELTPAFKYLQGVEYNLEGIVDHLENPEPFIDMCLFDGLTLNTDRHARNYAFIDGKLSPLFDNHSSYALKSFKDTGLSVPTREKNKPSFSDYLSKIIDMGYGNRIDLMSAKLDCFDPIKMVESSQVMGLIKTSS